ncbi:MAG TPA: molybdopterin-dependent oxidoreductase [Phycisphaerae bacterium]|nr:molybdopterin-dependent oxidoreductase [Phycisphaerae bacterium]HNU44952.1 molybdopterin-dependent oxidoreductase [Phycisphaerae bacterium]
MRWQGEYRRELVLLTGLAILLVGGCSGGPRRDGCGWRGGSKVSVVAIPEVNHMLELAGSGLSKPRSLSYRDLAGMPTRRVENVLMEKSHSPDEVTSWEGVPVRTLLAAAGLKRGPMRVEVRAADGFGMSMASDVLREAVLALKDGEGRWLAEVSPKSPLRLVVPGKPGNYWIMNPCRIVVEPGEGEEAEP